MSKSGPVAPATLGALTARDAAGSLTALNASDTGRQRERGAPIEPLVVSPKTAMQLLQIKRDKLYALLRAGSLESYLDGGQRRITVASIKRRIAEGLASAGKAA